MAARRVKHVTSLNHWRCGMDLSSVYNELSKPFAEMSVFSTDVQTDFSERLSLIEALSGSKPSFTAFLNRAERTQAFEAVAAALPSHVHHGFVHANVHHRYRALKINDAWMAALVDQKSEMVIHTFWLARDLPTADVFRTGAQWTVSDASLLGYPVCCATWHYDAFFARGTEAFCAVAEVERSSAMLDYLSDRFQPNSGFYLPEPLFVAAILRSNWQFPFIEHIACANCIRSDTSPSAVENERRSSLGHVLDPTMHDRVADWARRQEVVWRDLSDRRTALIRECAADCAETVRGRDEYITRARHLGKALGL